MFTMLPFFHMMGLLSMVRAIFHAAPLILTPVGRPVVADLVVEIVRYAKPWGCFVVPSILQEISKKPEGLEVLRNVEYIFYGGAPLAPGAGKALNALSRPTSLIGTTEIGPIHTLLPAIKDDWEFFEWVPEGGVVMERDSGKLLRDGHETQPRTDIPVALPLLPRPR